MLSCFPVFVLLLVVVAAAVAIFCVIAVVVWCSILQESEPSLTRSSEFSEEEKYSHKEIKPHTQIQTSSSQHEEEQNGVGPGTEPTEINTVIKMQSSRLAAAIVNSAPLLRRQVFLQPSHSFDYNLDTTDILTEDSAMKRRTWHVERVTARMLSVLGESGSSLAGFPVFNRSFSNEVADSGTVQYGQFCSGLVGYMVGALLVLCDILC